ncbi:MAG: NAD(P)-dependent glycerol-3-phosphate dehydrogenase [Alphaproteobacteria bacterium]|nr:NAD(P)-dependent glycerol-3-phosphate dehydrogenase [Alphaproteobacteria bacterium]
MNEINSFAVIGAGAWGTALAQSLARAGREVILWAREDDVCQTINKKHENTTYLPNIELDPSIKATQDFQDIIDRQAWLFVTPVQHTRKMARHIATLNASKEIPLILANKGIEKDTLSFPSDIIAQELKGHPIAILSGPSFASEVAKGQITALTLACADEALGQNLCQAISSRTLRPYASTDVIGAQIGGAIKNVMAIATGIAAGSGLGENARAALITRGLAEMMRLGRAMGAEKETLMGLSGLGDLILTCASTTSRNMSLGYALGQGQSLESILAERQTIAEGVPTAQAAAALAAQKGIEMPIVTAVQAILQNKASVQDIIAALVDRPLKVERA